MFLKAQLIQIYIFNMFFIKLKAKICKKLGFFEAAKTIVIVYK
jgi:hypothetical protein